MCRVRLRISQGEIPLTIATNRLDVKGDLVGHGIVWLFLEQRDVVLHLTVGLPEETHRLDVIGESQEVAQHHAMLLLKLSRKRNKGVVRRIFCGNCLILSQNSNSKVCASAWVRRRKERATRFPYGIIAV